MKKSHKQAGATDLLSKLSNATISAEEYAQDIIASINTHSDLNAVSFFDPEVLLTAAKEADKERAAGSANALCGLPLIVKDNINTTMYPTSAGTTALLNHTPKTCAGVVIDLEAQGGIIGAKAGMHELAFGITSNNAVTGAVCNPHDKTKIAGGSSGGTASAVAAGIFPVGLGSDTGGSCRIPAALCGVVGFRPTGDSYAGDGIVPISHTRDTAGPLARNVDDIVLIDNVLRRKHIMSAKPMAMSDVRLGVPNELFYENLESEVATAVQANLRQLETAGAKLVEVSFGNLWENLEAVGFAIAAYEVMQDLPAYLKEHAPTITFETLLDNIGSPDVGGILRNQFSQQPVTQSIYRSAMDIYRPAMQAKYMEIFQNHTLSAIVFPTTPVRAQSIGLDDHIELNGQQESTFLTYIRNTEPGSVLGVPGISLPCSNVTGLPVGIEFDGLAGRDADLLSLASLVEQALTQ